MLADWFVSIFLSPGETSYYRAPFDKYILSQKNPVKDILAVSEHVKKSFWVSVSNFANFWGIKS